MALRMIIALGLLAVGARCQLGESLSESDIEVHLYQGIITGELVDAGNGRFYYAFKSIPYAQPPIGDLRFQNPLPSGPWTGSRNGSQTAPVCPQPNQGQIIGQEDCLYLNVYAPKLDYPSALPVMVYIHGGKFLYGSVNDMSPLPLLTENVILVNFHYRLGTLGFLSTEDSVMPGNLGLKDQTMALLWVQENIYSLGGDPSRVTIFGPSSGAASAHFQILSPHASGLFNRAILQSGTALCSWSLRRDHREVAAEAGKRLNCSGIGSSTQYLDSRALLQCLRTVPLEKLVTLPSTFFVWSTDPLVMVPRVDGHYIPADPATMLMDGNYNVVDLITGITPHDGAETTNVIYSNEDLRNSLVGNFSEVGPVILNFRDGDENPEYLARRVFNHYLDEIKITKDNADTVTQIFTDRLFAICNDHTALLHVGHFWHNNVYMYELHHRGEYTSSPVFNTTETDNWVGHGDEVQYLFDSVSGNQQLQRPGDLTLRHIMVKLWTNFAKTGNPTPNQSLGFRWWPVASHCLRHLRIKEASVMYNDNRTQIRNFWNDLPTRQNSILFPERFGYHYSTYSQLDYTKIFCP